MKLWRPRTRTLFLIASLGSALLATVAAAAGADGLIRERLAGVLPAEEAAALAEALRTAILLAGAGAAAIAFVLGLGLAAALVAPLRALRAELLRAMRRAVPTTHLRPSGIADVDSLVRAVELFANDLGLRAERLGRERGEMALLVNAVSEGIMQLEPGGRVVRVNPAARTLLGLPAEAEGQPVASLVRHGELRRVLERAADGTNVPTCEVTIDERRLLVAARPLSRVGGAQEMEAEAHEAADAPSATGIGAVVAFADLTELRRLEGVRRDFVANASHELKTPLTSIRGYAETLLDDTLPAELRRQFLEAVRNNSKRLQNIVDDLLDLSRLESGGWRPELADVPVADIAEEAWAGFQERAGAQQITFAVRSDAEDRVRADVAALRQVFANLFDNALRHTSAGGRITVRVAADARHSGRLTIEVQDDGAGIPGDALPRIFERFYRVDPARSRAEGGTGLGLSIVRHLVETMGGGVAAESELGKGTVIRLGLPAATSSVAASKAT